MAKICGFLVGNATAYVGCWVKMKSEGLKSGVDDCKAVSPIYTHSSSKLIAIARSASNSLIQDRYGTGHVRLSNHSKFGCNVKRQTRIITMPPHRERDAVHLLPSSL